MAFVRGALVALAPLILAACASVSPSAPSADLESGNSSPYGLFLAAQSAVDHGDSAQAEALFTKAAAGSKGVDEAFLRGQEFTYALLAGDISHAAAIAPSGPDADRDMAQLGALVRGVDELADGRSKAARRDIVAAETSPATSIAAALLAPFAAAEAGDREASIAQPVIAQQPAAQFFARLDQGLLFEHARRYDEAETAYRSLIAKGDPGGLASLDLGQMQERRGRAADAVATYDAAIARNKADSSLLAARARAAAHKPAPAAPSLRRSAAEAMVASASAFVARKDVETGLAYLRLALRLDATRDEAWIMVGDVLAEIGDTQGARAAWSAPKPGSAQFGTARGKLVWSYQSANEKDEALAAARAALAAQPGDADAAINLADILRANERYDESSKILDGLIAAQGEHVDWKLLYMRAVDAEESGRWAEAERDLQRALTLRPDEPELLNFLGYSWIDRGEKLPQALAMVQKAVTLDPQSGAMIDSLGWGYYRLGQYQQAVEKLETAVSLEAGDPDVNNHLGDAYWRVGRRLEARFQWERVLTLDPSAKLKAEVQGKLKSGLDGPPAPAQVADQTPHT
jgi:tetratricopeptide (TPR) repeat protein